MKGFIKIDGDAYELNEIERNCTAYSDRDISESLDEILDSLNEPYKIGELEFSASQILKCCDPATYQDKYNEYLDANDYIECNDDYFRYYIKNEIINSCEIKE